MEKLIYTIGHSTNTIEKFLAMLNSFHIQTLIDIRGLPGSRKFPQFDKENLEIVLPDNGIDYLHIKELGGRRKTNKDSNNTRWHNLSFRNYADYMETADFENGIIQLQEIAIQKKTAYMCAEAVWWRCHRAMVSDYLKAKGWTVLHIMGIGKVEEHNYTSPAIVKGDLVCYHD